MSEPQNMGHQQQSVCKHYQRGYCRKRSQCSQEHNNNICKERVCRNPRCRERHPKTCKYFLINGECPWKEECAYEHKKSDNNPKIDLLESEVIKLKHELKQLNSNMSEMMIKLITLEESEKHFNSVHQNSVSKEGESNIEFSKKEDYNCNKCNFSCDTNHALTVHVDTEHEIPDFYQCKICKSCFDTLIQLKKHTNTKHMSTDKNDYQFKCKVCKKVFWNSLDLVKHLNDHVVKENIKYTECHDEPFRCKICGTFTSVNDDDIRKHVIKHVEETLKPKEDLSKDVTKILPTIEEESEESETERDEIEEAETSLNDSDLFAGFDEDGNRINDDD